MKKQKSFTLIEVLVVVAVIGLLGSIILVSTKGAREKAKIARLIQFSGSVHHTLGAYAVGIWNFNEGVAGTCVPSGDVCDVSGNGNHGTWHGLEPHWVDHDNPQLKKAFKKAGQFSGDDYVEVPYSASMNEAREAITIEFWLKQIDSSGHQDLLVSGGVIWWIWLNEGKPEAEFAFDLGSGVIWLGGPCSNVPLEAGKWNHLVVTYDGSKMRMFLNGDDSVAPPLERQDPLATIAGGPLFLGWGINPNFKGLMDEVRIYSEGLSSSQIKKHYVEGLEKHKDYSIKK